MKFNTLILNLTNDSGSDYGRLFILFPTVTAAKKSDLAELLPANYTGTHLEKEVRNDESDTRLCFMTYEQIEKAREEGRNDLWNQVRICHKETVKEAFNAYFAEE